MNKDAFRDMMIKHRKLNLPKEPLLSHAVLGEGWRDASEKAPEHKRVLGWLDDGTHKYYEFICYVKISDREGWVRISSGLFINYVKAWMPLPDPPSFA